MLASCEIVVGTETLQMALMVLVNYYELLRFNEARIWLF